MTINITHNDDGSITAECNGEEVKFFPKTRTAPRDADATPIIVGPWNPPIMPGKPHRAFVYVPVGNEPGLFEPSGQTPTVRYLGSQSQLERDLVEVIVTNQLRGPSAIQVITPVGAKLDVRRVQAAADNAITNFPVALYLISDK